MDRGSSNPSEKRGVATDAPQCRSRGLYARSLKCARFRELRRSGSIAVSVSALCGVCGGVWSVVLSGRYGVGVWWSMDVSGGVSSVACGMWSVECGVMIVE